MVMRDIFDTHRTSMETTVSDNIAAAPRTAADRLGNRAHERNAADIEARPLAGIRGGRQPSTGRGRRQASAARGVALETSREMEAQEPEIIAKIKR